MEAARRRIWAFGERNALQNPYSSASQFQSPYLANETIDCSQLPEAISFLVVKTQPIELP